MRASVQKTRCWTAGLKSGKVRGFRVKKFGLICKYVYTGKDCGLIVRKAGVSLTKFQGRTGTRGSRPLDRDHAAQDEAVPRSNLGRASRIGRPREIGRGAATGTRRDRCPAAARGRRR